jgi:iron complex transport system ATP-binding protein
VNDETILKVERLSAGYGDTCVLHDISFDLHAGEFLGVVGPNGSGKSTLLRAITQSIPSTGDVEIQGGNANRLRPNELARLMAVVPQQAVLPEGFSVLEIALMGRTPYLRMLQSEGQDDMRIARRSLLQTDTLRLASRAVNDLSGGERQRVIVARALTQQSPILLLDEPTVHLDIGQQMALLDLVGELVHEHMLSVIAVIHDLSLAAQYCDRVILIQNGVVHSIGCPTAVLNPASISDVYETEVIVIEHPTTFRPVILPVPSRDRRNV